MSGEGNAFVSWGLNLSVSFKHASHDKQPICSICLKASRLKFLHNVLNVDLDFFTLLQEFWSREAAGLNHVRLVP